MRLLASLVLSNETIIKVLAVFVTGPGIDIEKDDPLAYWPCRITWTDISTDEHVALLDKDLVKKDFVNIINCSKNNIKKGFYKVNRTPDKGIVLEEIVFEEK